MLCGVLAVLVAACLPGVPQPPNSTEPPAATAAADATLEVLPGVPTVQVGPVGAVPNPNTVPVPEPNSCHASDGLPDHKCTPGVLNPNVSLVNGELLIRVPNGITLRFCNHEFSTRMIRPPTSYTDVLKRRLMVAYGLPSSARLADFELDHDVALTDLGHPWSPMNLWPEPRAGTANAIEKDSAEAAVHTRICADQPHAFMYAAQLAQDWRPFSRRPVGATPEPATEPEP
jgi:hypothetical protein